VTPDQALKLAWEALQLAFRIADAFDLRSRLKAKMRAEMSDMFDEAEHAIEAKHKPIGDEW
jgi:hypothetical protein